MSVTGVHVALDKVAYHFDKPYDYLLPDAMAGDAREGCRVMVPFGAGNRRRQGIILSFFSPETPETLKPVLQVMDREPLLSRELLKLAQWLREHIFCTVFDAVKAMLPAGLQLKTVRSYRYNPEFSELDLKKQEELPIRIFQYLSEVGSSVSSEKLMDLFALEAGSALLEQMAAKGFLLRNEGFSRNRGDATVKMVQLAVSEEEAQRQQSRCTPKQKSVLKLLLDVGSASVKEICYFAGVTQAVVQNLQAKGFVEYYENEVFRNPYQQVQEVSAPPPPILLTPYQSKAYETLRKMTEQDEGGAALLFGVTGSGKTQVFLKLIDQTLAQGKQAIVMVPEIALTSQTLALFHRRYGKKVAVFHSALSVGERMDEYKRVRRGEAEIVVGTRSAVFAPFERLGLIIMDEEQEHTYKSECTPRYHARDVARFRCAYQKALLVLASATPSIETYTAALQGRYTLCELPERYGSATLPEVITVDMKQELRHGCTGGISSVLAQALEETLAQGHQSILLINRRGYHTFVACASCGHVVTCPHCSISMTYHAANRRLMCHYCGYSTPLPGQCEECGEKDIRYSGFGTQKMEQELGDLFPQARILRMDTDTTMTRYAHEEKLKAFGDGEYDMMIGTQMVAKGLDFANVTLVGVVNADQSLYSENYGASERTFSLLTQVVGRSGRGESKGKAVIQTMTPENPVIRLAAEQDYPSFYKMEIATRRLMVYPPFCDLFLIGFIADQERCALQCAASFFEALKKYNQEEFSDCKLIVLGPLPARVAKVSNRYRYQLLVKCRSTRRMRQMLSKIYCETCRDSAFKNTTIFIDFNPEDCF